MNSWLQRKTLLRGVRAQMFPCLCGKQAAALWKQKDGFEETSAPSPCAPGSLTAARLETPKHSNVSALTLRVESWSDLS